MQFNGDGGANYNWEQINFAHTTDNSGASALTTAALAGYLPGVSSVANTSSIADILISNYADTVFSKSYVASSGAKIGAGQTGLTAQQIWGDWISTAAINSVSISPASGAFTTGAVVSLYGYH